MFNFLEYLSRHVKTTTTARQTYGWSHRSLSSSVSEFFSSRTKIANSFPRLAISFRPTPVTFGNATKRSLLIHWCNDVSIFSVAAGTTVSVTSQKSILRPKNGSNIVTMTQNNTPNKNYPAKKKICQTTEMHWTLANWITHIQYLGPDARTSLKIQTSLLYKKICT